MTRPRFPNSQKGKINWLAWLRSCDHSLGQRKQNLWKLIQWKLQSAGQKGAILSKENWGAVS